MLISLKVSSSACKWAFYGPEHNANVGPHGTDFWIEMQKLNIPTDRAQRSAEKNGSQFSSYHVYSQSYIH